MILYTLTSITEFHKEMLYIREYGLKLLEVYFKLCYTFFNELFLNILHGADTIHSQYTELPKNNQKNSLLLDIIAGNAFKIILSGSYCHKYPIDLS